MAGAPAVTTTDVIRAGFAEAAVLVIGGVVLGGIGGFWGVATGGTAAEMASDAAKPYLAMAVLLPVLLVILNFTPPKLEFFSTLTRGLLVGIIAGGAGGLVAALAYFVPAANLPTIFQGASAGDMYDAVRSEVGLGRFLLVFIVSLAAGVIAGALTHYRVAAYRRAQGI